MSIGKDGVRKRRKANGPAHKAGDTVRLIDDTTGELPSYLIGRKAVILCEDNLHTDWDNWRQRYQWAYSARFLHHKEKTFILYEEEIERVLP